MLAYWHPAKGGSFKSQNQWFYPDRNGNTSVITDDGGTILESYRYDAFGLPTVYSPTGTILGATGIANRHMFTGREWRYLFGFYEYRARAYSPTLGRFMSEDPIGFKAGDYNLYRYCANGRAICPNLERTIGANA